MKMCIKKMVIRIKRYKCLKSLYHSVVAFLTDFSPTICTKLVYFVSRGERINLKNPKLFNEKIMWLKLNTYYNNKKVKRCVDKYTIRHFAIEKGLKRYLPKLYGKWDRPDEMDFKKLPDSFVIKCNHGCGYNIIISDKTLADSNSIKAKLNAWMKEDIYKEYGETVYKGIKKRIICEELIGNGIDPIVDYKFYCFNGEVKTILLCEDRTEESVKLTWVTPEWKILDIGLVKTTTNVNKPESLDEMMDVAKILSAGFPFVRVDLYYYDKRIYIGEMTFTPYAGVANYYTEDGERLLGDWLKLP